MILLNSQLSTVYSFIENLGMYRNPCQVNIPMDAGSGLKSIRGLGMRSRGVTNDARHCYSSNICFTRQ